MGGSVIEFYKMNGAGNDFVVIDNREDIIPEDYKSEFTENVCRRRVSVGADGILLVEPSEKATFRMRYFNADGSEGEMCGNGARCIARFAFLKGIADKKMSIETMSGIINAEIVNSHAKISVNPVTEKELHKKITVDGNEFSVHYIEEGTPGLPHTVVFKDDLTMEEDIEDVGRKIRYHTAFSRGTNVNFCRVKGRDTIVNRTYERGVERETLACGTGSAAAACVTYLLGKCGKKITVETKGGILEISILDENLKNIYLTGDAQIVYKGVLEERQIF